MQRRFDLMKTGWSERVREVADREYVQPARLGRKRVRIQFGDLRARMVKLGFPAGHFNQIATPLESSKFWEPRGLEMCTPKGQSRNDDTVFEFRFVDEQGKTHGGPVETPKERALRAADELRGLLKEEIASFGGAEAFLRWVRSDDDEDAA
jgi:hypothetical protein